MSTRNSQKHFSVGIGVYTPWRNMGAAIRESLSTMAPKRAYEWKIGCWKEGRVVEGKPKTVDNRRIRVRGVKGWLKPKPVKELRYHSKKGWQPKG